jgi:endonuclease YncB( thermonuclease family)
MLNAALFACLSPAAVDGDTIRCRDVGLVRLVGIDAPELPGHCRVGRECTPGDGFAAKRALAALLRQGPVICAPTGRDKYGRLLARCTVARQDLSCTMVARRQAVVRYTRLKCQF